MTDKKDIRPPSRERKARHADQSVTPLFVKAGIARPDEACLPIDTPQATGRYVSACKALRYWQRMQEAAA